MPPFEAHLFHVAALVELAERPRLATTIKESIADELAVDMAVTAVFRPLDPDELAGVHLTVCTPTRPL